ncbi:arsenite efflux pump ACR3-like permease [Desulfocapsa sulfexigens DSM 10523]|uniref:Arsenite efflux pump ACR3-like permease n=1 Tax=Desulfocapsa sulfexigens (strain DSM 10523 / SB164P1) TaxID=1167006 RepID=M1P7G5_DESSD|nr:arsenic resistance protein [Desulfocapsa sulfexigens]AGF79408.1 arsenite efflux pump ACR3-like permease [Desulfocapsa sulfexigens DSM 10523]
MSLRAVFTFPSRNLVAVIPCVICVALLCGLFVDTSPLKILILPVAMLTIFPAMIGFQPQELLELTDLRLMSVNLVLNFLALPLAALLIGKLFLESWPELQAGLLIISVVPGGNMAVAFTMLFEGNVRASLKLSTLNLILGSLLAPLYLFFLAGTLVEIDIVHIGRTIGLVVFIPLFAGVYTYRMLLKKISQEEFKEKIKPLLPAFSVWGLIYLLFTSISMKAEMFFGYPETIFQALSCLLLWYCTILTICVIIGRNFFSYKDAISLLLNVELRNLPICIGIALAAFPPKTAMMIALAFLFQQQLAIWFWKLNKKYPLLKH